MNIFPSFLPPTNELREGNVFTDVCLSTGGGGGGYIPKDYPPKDYPRKDYPWKVYPRKHYPWRD